MSNMLTSMAQTGVTATGSDSGAGVKGTDKNRYQAGDFKVGDEVYLDGDYSTAYRVGQVSGDSIAVGTDWRDFRWANVAMIPPQPRDMPKYMYVALVTREYGSGSGRAPARALQESWGIPQPSGWIGDTPTYNQEAQRAAAEAGLPLPVWGQRGEGTPVHVASGGEITTTVVASTYAPPVTPPPIPVHAPTPVEATTTTPSGGDVPALNVNVQAQPTPNIPASQVSSLNAAGAGGGVAGSVAAEGGSGSGDGFDMRRWLPFIIGAALLLFLFLLTRKRRKD